jgi:hypothetical protein
MKFAEEPDATLSVPGTVSAALSLLSAKLMPPLGTALESDTVQELLALGPRLFGMQTTEVTFNEAASEMLVLAEDPLLLAVTLAVPSAAMLLVVALKFVELPDATLTVAGTVRLALSLLTDRLIPPAGTVFESAAVQELLAFGPRLFGVQTRDVTVTGVTRAMLALLEEPL